MMHGIAVVAILFFGFCTVFRTRKLLDNRPGLILNASGLLDNSSAVAAGFVPWPAVVGFSIFEVQNQKTLVVRVREPERYIVAGGMLKRMLNRMDDKLCGSPVVISANFLKLGFNELLQISQAYFHRCGDK
ncbi:STM3941 family protein [Undibacterium sp. Ji42W]|uniref:STM3941 family protein n=1 Tax=Undibacterium sp. Ji42W TaxID=3413039 RepID=UPI003BF07BA6